MIIQRNSAAPSIGDIVSFKTTNSEEIVGKLVSQDHNYQISSPLVLGMVSPTQLAFGPFMTSIDDNQTVTFVRENVVSCPIRVRKDVENTYRQMTSGITIPTNEQTSTLLRG